MRVASTGFAVALGWLLIGGCGGIAADESAGGNSSAGGSGQAGHDASVPRGGGSRSADGAVSCGGGACPSPALVTGFVPTWKPPTGAHQGSCTATLVDAYYQACIAGGGNEPCSDFGPAGDKAHQACGQCLVSSFSAPVWGPLVVSSGIIETNEAGCIALLDPGAIDCAKAVQALDQCQHAACDPVCSAVGSANAFDDWVQCSAAANACSCASQFAASDCVHTLVVDAGAAAQCFVGQTFQDFFEVTANAFCSP